MSGIHSSVDGTQGTNEASFSGDATQDHREKTIERVFGTEEWTVVDGVADITLG